MTHPTATDARTADRPAQSRTLSLSVAPDIAARYPDCRTAAVLVLGLKNAQPWPETEDELSRLEGEVRDGERTLPQEDEPAIAAWHDLLRSFGTNPRRTRPSVDALRRRLVKAGRLPRISPLVDTCNLVSMNYMLPTGGYDLRGVTEGFCLRYARPGDTHVPLGRPEERETPVEGEVVYGDGSHVLTRHWNHRDADSTKVTAESREVMLLLEGISSVITPEELARAQRELADRVAPHSDSVALYDFDHATDTKVTWVTGD
jgi:DNA/RNA-binding domain of Phe-tRNA-synthetase-like protein